MIDLSKYSPQWTPLSAISTQNNMFQFRKEVTLESVADLARSLSADGQKFPIIVWQRNSGEAVPVSGLRRIAAAASLNWEKILSIIIPENELSEEEALRLNFIENIERKTLTNLDIMFSCKKLKEQGKTNEQIGKLIGKDERTVRRYIGITELSQEEQNKVKNGEMPIRDAGSAETGTRADAGLNNKNYIVKSTKNGIDAKIKIEANLDNEASINAFIAEVKKAWKQALKKSKKSAKRRARAQAKAANSDVTPYTLMGEGGDEGENSKKTSPPSPQSSPQGGEEGTRASVHAASGIPGFSVAQLEETVARMKERLGESGLNEYEISNLTNGIKLAQDKLDEIRKGK